MIRARFLILLFVCFLSACQPAPEERYSRAQDYFAENDYRAVVLELKNALQTRSDYPEARLLLGRAAYQLADFETAQAEFERALNQGSTGPDVWADLGRALLAQGDAAGALERVVPNIDASTADAAVLVLLGDIYLALGNVASAGDQYQRALQQDPATPGALIGQAVIARIGGDIETAEALLDQAVASNPESAFVWRAKGNYLRSERRFAASADAYGRSIDLEDAATPQADQLMTRINRISVLLDAQQIDAADAQLAELESSFPRHSATRFSRGRVAYAKGDYQLAENELREYLADVPSDIRGYALLGAVSFSQNHLEQAEVYLAQSVRNNVGGSAMARLLAETRLRLNKPEEALSALGGQPIDGSDAGLLAMYGRAQLGLGNTDAALDFFEQGANSESLSPSVGLSLAAGFFAAGENDRAVEILQNVPAQSDDKYLREALLIAAHLRAGNKAAANKVGDETLKNNSQDPSAFSLVGALNQSLGNLVKARIVFERGLKLDDGHLPTLYALSRLELIEGNVAEAESLLGRLLDLEPDFMPALLTLAGIFVEDERGTDLIPRLDAAIQADRSALPPRLMQIRLLLLEDMPTETMQAIAEAKKLYPDDARLLHAEGLAHAKQGSSEAALISFRRAANIDKSNPVFQYDFAAMSVNRGNLDAAAEAVAGFRALLPDSYRGLALQVAVHIRQGEFIAARTAVDGFAAANPNEDDLVILRGDIEMARGNPDSAVAYYEQAEDREYNRGATLRLARAYQAENPEKAIKALSGWLTANPTDVEARRLYGQMLESQGHWDAAVAEYEKVLATGSTDVIALNNLAWQYAEQGRPEAAELAARAHQLAPKNGSVADTYGWILYRQGEYDRALILLEQAARLSPGNPEILYHLAAAHAKSGNRQKASELVSDLLASHSAFPSRVDAEKLASTL